MSSHPLDPTPILMSGAALPHLPVPPGEAPAPQTADPHEPKRGSRLWVWGLVALGAAGAGYWYWNQTRRAAEATPVALTRSATVTRGAVSKTLRLTGTTAAERFSSLIAPTLRGRRSGNNNSASTPSSTPTQTASMVQSTSSNVSAAATTSSNGSVSSTAGAAGGTALRSARSASGARTAASSTRSSSSGGSAAASSSNSNLGSTANQLVGTPGGGGGGNDFTLLLQEVVDSGTTVQKGQRIAEFDRQYMLLRLDDYKANVVQSEQDFKRQMAELEITRKAYEQQVLAARNMVEKAELDVLTIPVRSAIQSEQLKLSLEEAKANLQQQLKARPYLDIGEKAQVRTAQLDLEQSKIELRRAENNAGKMIVEAPIGGLAVMQSTFRGAEFGAIQQGDQVYPGQMFMQIVDPSSMIVNATVNQADVQALRIGQRARIHFDAFPDLELPGRLVMIGAMTKAGGARGQFKKDVPVRFALDQMDPRVIPDLSVSADVILAEAPEGVVVPREAVFTDAPAAGGEADASPRRFVYVRDRGSRWTRRPVELGVESFTRAAVKSGLQPGEVVALEAPPSAPAGQPQEQPQS